MSIFSQRLKSARNAAKIEQKDVADKVGIHVVTLSRYENGKREPKVCDAIKLAALFNVSLGYLVGEPTISASQTSDTPPSMSTRGLERLVRQLAAVEPDIPLLLENELPVEQAKILAEMISYAFKMAQKNNEGQKPPISDMAAGGY